MYCIFFIFDDISSLAEIGTIEKINIVLIVKMILFINNYSSIIFKFDKPESFKFVISPEIVPSFNTSQKVPSFLCKI